MKTVFGVLEEIMKLILRGKMVEDESTEDAIFKILGDKCSRKILESAMDSPKSALDLQSECKISLTLVYKKLQKLLDCNLMQISRSIIKDGRKYTLYKSKAHPIMILLNGKHPSQTVVLDSDVLIHCIGCESFNCGLYYDERYNGMRSICYSCGANWPES